MPTLSYTNRHPAGTRQTTEVLSDGIVRVTVRKWGSTHVYQVPLSQLNPHYTTYTESKITSVWGAGTLVLTSAAFCYFGFKDDTASRGSLLLFLACICFGLASLAICNWWVGRLDVILFMDKGRKRTLLSIPRGKDAAECDAFVLELVNQIPKD